MNEKADRRSTKLPPLLPKTAAAANYHQRVFLPRLAERLEELSRVPLTIFVCGPSNHSDPLTRKKLDTVNRLRELGHNALIGEEIVEELKEQDRHAKRPVRPNNVYEMEVALGSHMVVIFRTSHGSVAEFHEFYAVPRIAAKILVFADEAHEESYSSTGVLAMHRRLHGKVELYRSPDDISECVLTTKLLQYVEVWQAAEWLRQQGGGT